MIPSPPTSAATGLATANHNHTHSQTTSLYQNHVPSPVMPAPAPVRIFKRGDRISYPGTNGDPARQLQPPPIRNPVQPTTAPPVTQMQSASVPATSAPVAPWPAQHLEYNPKTATTLVVELAKFHKLNPEFKLIQTEGPPHCPTFTVQCSIGDGGSATAKGPSIKRATVAAAEALLEITTLPFPPPKLAYRSPGASARGGRGAGPERKPRPPRGSGIRARGDEPPMPMTVAMNSGAGVVTTVATAALPTAPSNTVTVPPVHVEKNPISLLNEFCTRNRKKLSYTLVEERGPAHSKMFRMRCVVDDVLSTEGEGCTKQLAKTEASKEMVQQIPELAAAGAGAGHSQTDAVDGQLDGAGAAVAGRGRASANRKPKPRLKIIREDGGAATTGSDSPINKLSEFALHSGLGEPKYDCWEEDPVAVAVGGRGGGGAVAVSGLSKKKVYVVQARVGAAGGYVAVGKAFRKQDAKSSAAANLVQALNQQQLCGLHHPGQPQQQGAMPKTASNSSSNSTATPASFVTPAPTHQTTAAASLVTGHQLKPGLIVLNKPNDHEHTDKLSYLADLIGFRLSFADFPKNDEYLSVLSLSTDPPHVAHGLGATLTEARNEASLKILEKLKETGLESGPSALTQN